VEIYTEMTLYFLLVVSLHLTDMMPDE